VTGDGPASPEVLQVATEVAATSPHLTLVHVDAAADPERARALGGERTPLMVFSAPSAKGTLRYYGLPAGYEMSTLVAALLDLGGGTPLVPPEIATKLDGLSSDVHVQVFVTPG
jgi:alkyl hydroperoxide reductase subunit AhpF